MADIKKNLADEIPASQLNRQTRVFVYRPAGFSDVDGPAADTAARNNPPEWSEIGDITTYAGAFVSTGQAGKIYTHSGSWWLCLANTTQTPQQGSGSWAILNRDHSYRGDWVANTSYLVGDLVRSAGEFYRCTAAHTSTNLTQDRDNGRWLFDTFPSFMQPENDSLGVNTDPDAVVHAMSYQNHPHAHDVGKFERFETDDAYVSIAAGGQERGRFGYSPSLRMVIDAVDHVFIRTLQGSETTYTPALQIARSRVAPNSNTQNMDLGTAGVPFDRIYANRIPAARTFDSISDRDATILDPIEGQLAHVGNELQIYRGGNWISAEPLQRETLLSLDDTPGVYGAAGSRLVVGRDRTGLVWQAGAIPPEVRDGWARQSNRDFAPSNISDATNFLQVQPNDTGDSNYDGVGLMIGERFISAPSGVIIPPYSGETSPDIRYYRFAATALPGGGGVSLVTNFPRYQHGSSQGTLAEFQWAGLDRVEWGGTEYRIKAYYDPHNTSRRSYFAFSQSQLFNSPTFGQQSAGDRIFHLRGSDDELYSIAVPSPDESHLEDYEIYALIRNRIVKIRFNNDPDATSLLSSDPDTEPQVTTVAEFTRHADQEDIANRKYFVGDLFDGNRSRGLTWQDNVLFWGTNLGIFAIDSYNGQRITELDTTWNDVGGYPSGFDNQNMDVAGVAWYGDYLYVLYHMHHSGDRATDSSIRAYRWQGDPVGRFATQPAVSGSPLTTQQAGGLPNWVVLHDAEQSLEAPVLRTSHIRNDGVDRTAQQQFTSRASGVVDIEVGADLHTYKLSGRMLGDFLPAGIGHWDAGDEGSSAFRNMFTQNVRTRRIAPRVPFDRNNPSTTGLRLEAVTSGRGNFESARVYASQGDRTLAIPVPFTGQMTYLTDTELLYVWDGTQWIDVGGEHAGEHHDLSQVNANIIPLVDNVWNVGRSDRRWAELYAEDIITSNISAGTQHSGILWLGETDRGVLAFRGQTNFANASVRGVATSITHSLQYSDGDVEFRLVDDASNIISTTTLTPTQIAQSLGRYGISRQIGHVLTLGPSNTPQWSRTASHIALQQATGQGSITIELIGTGGGSLVSGVPPTLTPNMIATALGYITSTATVVIGGRDIHFSGTGQVKGPRFVTTTGGSLANVAYGFDGNDNTGILSSSANNLGFVTGGEERWRVTNHGSLVPNPRNVLNDDESVGTIGQDAEFHRANLYGGFVNYQTLTQASGIDRKFGVIDIANADVDNLLRTRIRKFRYRDRPQIQQIGVVLEELPSTFFQRNDDGSIDISSVLWGLVALAQWQQQQITSLENRVSGSLPTRSRGSNANAGSGVAPPGWQNTGGGRRRT